MDDTEIDENDTDTVKMIKQILSTRVRPFVQDDGGDVKFVEFNPETGVMKLKMEGSCSGCPSSSATLRNGILKAMTYYVGEVKNVVSVEEEEQR